MLANRSVGLQSSYNVNTNNNTIVMFVQFCALESDELIWMHWLSLLRRLHSPSHFSPIIHMKIINKKCTLQWSVICLHSLRVKGPGLIHYIEHWKTVVDVLVVWHLCPQRWETSCENGEKITAEIVNKLWMSVKSSSVTIRLNWEMTVSVLRLNKSVHNVLANIHTEELAT